MHKYENPKQKKSKSGADQTQNLFKRPIQGKSFTPPEESGGIKIPSLGSSAMPPTHWNGVRMPCLGGSAMPLQRKRTQELPIQAQTNGTTPASTRKSTEANPRQEQSNFEQWQKENAPKVTAVKSLAEQDLIQQNATTKTELASRQALRLKDINNSLLEITKYLNDNNITKIPQWLATKKTALEKDKAKSLAEIIASEDSKFVAKDRRNKIIESQNAINAKNTEITTASEKWHEYDAKFTGSAELMNILTEIQISPAELKALIGQESGDLILSDTAINSGSYVGIAQIGANEATDLGYAKDDRKSPEKSIIIAAKILQNKIKATGIKPEDFANIKDYKSFAFAAYNKGQGTLKTAMTKATAMQRNSKLWNDLINGGKKSPMYYAINKSWPDTALDKYNEVVGYVDRIFKRLE